MAYEVMILESAKREYEQVVRYLLDMLGSRQAAASFMDEFDRQMALLETLPEAFALCSDPVAEAKGFRRVLVGNYCALYRVCGERVVVHHVFHQRQGYGALVI